MASSSKVSLTQARKLEENSDLSGCGKPQKERRAVNRTEVEMSWECLSCAKHIKKVKRSLVCACKEVVFCSFDCQQSSNHKTKCRGKEARDTTVHDPSQCDCHTQKDDEMDGFMLRTFRHSHEDILEMAEAGDAMAAYVVGSVYAQRKRCNIKGCDDGEDCPARGYSMPTKYLEKSILETDEIAIKCLKVAAEGGIPDAMFMLAMKLQEESGLVKDTRVAHYWLAKAYDTGKKEDLIEILENGAWGGLLAGEFVSLHDTLAGNKGDASMRVLQGPTLSHLLMATRWKELDNWGGKTANGKSFFGRLYFVKFMEMVGKLEKPMEDHPSMAFSEKRKVMLLFVSGRPGVCDAVTRSVVVKERNETNAKFVQGVKAEASPDLQLIVQTTTQLPEDPIPIVTYMEGRTSYLVSCKHHELQIHGAHHVQGPPGSNLGKKGMAMSMTGKMDFDDIRKCKGAGECMLCTDDAIQRLHAVAQGLYSLSLTEAIPNYGYAARYVNKEGVVAQDIFKSYSKPDMSQVLQCLMSNPADLHPLAVAEDCNLFWPIIWYWGSVFYAIQDTCDENTLQAVYGGLGTKITFRKSAPTSALEMFPETAAGEWRIACGSEQCPRLDHEVKFNLCKGCKVRRYCNQVCQRKDWPNHRKFCKADKEN